MKTRTFATAAEFLAAVGQTLGNHEAEHHLVLGIAAAHAREPLSTELFAVAIEDSEGLALAALMTDRRPLLIASDRTNVEPVLPLLADSLDHAGRTPTHTIAAIGQAEVIADELGRRWNRTPSLVMRQRVHKLTSVAETRLVSGKFRAASATDVDLIAAWSEAFQREALATLPSAHAPRSAIERRIAAGEIYLWCDPEPRSMVGSARPTARAIAVNSVYTPAEWRGRGYATASVAELSRRLLRRFEFCVLYTDLANPTSNAIYARIGYKPARDFLMHAW